MQFYSKRKSHWWIDVAAFFAAPPSWLLIFILSISDPSTNEENGKYWQLFISSAFVAGMSRKDITQTLSICWINKCQMRSWLILFSLKRRSWNRDKNLQPNKILVVAYCTGLFKMKEMRLSLSIATRASLWSPYPIVGLLSNGIALFAEQLPSNVRCSSMSVSLLVRWKLVIFMQMVEVSKLATI